MSEQVLASGVVGIPAGIMMSPFDLGEELIAVARNLPVEDGVLAVVVKGDGRGGVLIGGESANASQLATLIRRRAYGKRAIRLYACGVSEEFAQALDEASGAEVFWTRDIVWFGPETNGFASMVSGWYLDELFMLRPDYSQGAWETTRRGEWPSGQGPSDVSLPPGLPGLSPHWVHLRAETARFRAEPLPDLGRLRESEQAAKVAQARRTIAAAGEKLTQVYSMVDAPVLEAPASTVTAADSAETDALLTAAADETASAEVSVGHAQRQAEKLTVAEGELAEARRRQEELNAELGAARRDLVEKRAVLIGAREQEAELLRDQDAGEGEGEGAARDALRAQRADAAARVQSAIAEHAAVRERIDQLVAAVWEAGERIAEGAARVEDVRDIAKEAAETAAKAVAAARVAADRADVTVRQVDLPSYVAEGAMGSGKIWKPGSIDPGDVLAALPEGVREPARAVIEELFSGAKVM
ncbi:hypothetical protein ACWDKQ_36135, partial [Saccharopolyspora sp. NPDC000995]